MAFNLNPSQNSGKLGMSEFLSANSGSAEKRIPLDSLSDWENQPFKPYSDEALEILAASISENGLLSPIVVRQDGDKYKILAGHNRVRACRKLGWTDINAIVKDVDEQHANLIMVDTNLCQRQSLAPSELIAAYKIQFNTLFELGGKNAYGVKSALAERYGVSRQTITKYIKCANLNSQLIEMLDNGRFSVKAAVYLSDLSDGNQEMIADWLSEHGEVTVSEPAAQALAAKNGFGFDEQDICEIVLKKGAVNKKADKSEFVSPVEHGDIKDIGENVEAAEYTPPETHSKRQKKSDNSERSSSESNDNYREAMEIEKSLSLNPPTFEPQAADTTSLNLPEADNENNEEDEDDDENKKVTVEFTLQEVKMTLGNISEKELGDYLFYCMQKPDLFLEWLEMVEKGVNIVESDEVDELDESAEIM
jgi:ParB family chromosome partitioning protein